jgi:hypothetical protein
MRAVVLVIRGSVSVLTGAWVGSGDEVGSAMAGCAGAAVAAIGCAGAGVVEEAVHAARRA